MTIETFDQRFKRLTSDILMIDLCRILGIEIRHLMKIRSGVRVDLSMNGLRKLCLEQGLDFNSFIRGYDEPWSSELSPTQVITSDTPAEAPLQVALAKTAPPADEAERPGKQIFRPDGSRIALEPPPAPPKRKPVVETVRSTAPAPAAAPAIPKNLQVSFRPSKPAPAPTVPEKYETEIENDLFFEEELNPKPNIAARLIEAVSSTFRRNDAQSEQAELYSGVAPARVVTSTGSSDTSETPSTPLEAAQAKQIADLISEVSSLRQEIRVLSANVGQLLRR